MTVFDTQYAAQYDRLYAGKNYKSECDLIEVAIAKHAATRDQCGRIDVRARPVGCVQQHATHATAKLAAAHSIIEKPQPGFALQGRAARIEQATSTPEHGGNPGGKLGAIVGSGMRGYRLVELRQHAAMPPPVR